MANLTSTDIGTDLCNALGLSTSFVTKLTIVCEYGSLARVSVELIPTEEQYELILDVVAKEEYQLVKQTGTKPDSDL